MNKLEVDHYESASNASPKEYSHTDGQEVYDFNDKARVRRVVRSIDLKILPLCAFMYLLNCASPHAYSPQSVRDNC